MAPGDYGDVTPIRSRHHPFVQRCRRLAADPGAEPEAILLDGEHLLQEALQARLEVAAAAFSARARSQAGADRLIAALEQAGAEVFEASDPAIDAASPVRTPSGVVAIASMAPCRLAAVFSRQPALVAGVVDVQDPGNVGAIVRAAEAAGATGVVVAGQSANPRGWKAVRGSMGSVFRMPLAAGVDLDAAIADARAAGMTILAAAADGGHDLFDTDLRRPALVLIGSEGAGLPASLQEAADERIRIPMSGPVESLNVAVAAAVILFEARRQRRSAGTP